MSSQSWQSILPSVAFGNIKTPGPSSLTDDKKDDTEWMKSLTTRENIFYGGSPYMPILLENIPHYIDIYDFEFERIKEIQTIGIVFGENWHEATLFNYDSNNHVSVKLSLGCCKREFLYENDYRLELKVPCKLYGRLVKFEGKPLIEVHRLSKTFDPEGCLKTLTMLSQIVRQKYHYYVCSTDPTL